MSRQEEEKDSEKQSPAEIEKRCLVSHLPEDIRKRLATAQFVDIVQGYTSGNRLRQTTTSDKVVTYEISNKATMMYYTPGVDTRIESVRIMTAEEFQESWPQTEGARIEKRRYSIPAENGLTYELDLFKGAGMQGHTLVEVEFPTTAMAQQFALPEWFGRDVTRVVSNKKLLTSII